MTPSVDLPYRLLREAPSEPVLTVDGALGAEGLELSHWPGNRTPVEFRHRLSTGAALAFARLAPAEREARVRGLACVANNHYDTDGLCATWTVLNPERALELAEPLLRTAAAGDFFQVPDEAAFARDIVIQACSDRARSPIAADFEELDDHERLVRASAHVLENLGTWLESDLERGALTALEHLWRPALLRLRADRAELEGARRDERPSIDLTLFEIDAEHDRLPGRHALFAGTESDRVLLAAHSDSGTRYRLVVGTRSWFDLDPREAPPSRFDLERARDRLSALEPDRGNSGWHCDGGPHPSPELWFGRPGQPAFTEHHELLDLSQLTPNVVLDALGQ